MFGLLIYLVLSGISSCYSLKIDLSSIHTIPDLYRLCWRQFDDRKIDNITMYTNGNPIQLTVFEEKDEKDNTRYCVEKTGATGSYEVKFPMTENREDRYFNLTINFSMLLAPPFQIIRKEIVPAGVHLKLLYDYSGISSNIISKCVVILENEAKGKKKYNVIQMMSKFSSEYFHSLDPGTPFTIYYSCLLNNLLPSYSVFIVEKGEIFPEESTDMINPFIQFPFRRFLVAQWKHPSKIPNSYSMSIYEIQNKISKCLKIFRIFKSSNANSSDFEKSSLSHEGCGSNVPIEDLGFYDYIVNGSVYVVLDMFTFLRANVLHKFSILWLDRQWRMNNFIYFESWPNEKCGLVNTDIFNYDSSKYKVYRNITSVIRPNVFCQYNQMPFYEGSSLNMINKRLFVFPVFSSQKPLFELRNPLNYSIAKLMMNRNTYCSKTFYPFCYILIHDTSNKNVELIEVQKPEDGASKIREIKFTADVGDPGFTVSLDLLPESLTQAMFIVEIYNKDNKCVSIYILTCQTCSQRFKKLSEQKFERKINELKQRCKQSVQILENHYQATDKFISFRTKEMPYEQNFYPKVYSVNLFDVTIGVTKAPHFLKESFRQKYGNIFIGFFCSIAVVLIIVAIAVRCKLIVKTVNKEEDKEESNKYYGEDDL